MVIAPAHIREVRMTGRVSFLGLTAAALCAAILAQAANGAEVSCTLCAEWNRPQQPFRVYGNTYYVGTHGLASVLITSDQGHILIDGGLAESAPQIAAHIRALGFKVEDVRWILNSHAHYDHAGGIAELQKLTSASVAASPWSANVLIQGGPERGDPQYQIVPAIKTVPNVKVLADGESLRSGPLELTAHFTPGHTPGGTTWTWRSCEGGNCVNVVYADSLTAVSADGFRFTASRDYPNALADFEKSFRVLDTIPCDILLVPHPEFADVLGKLDRREQGVKDAFIDQGSCRNYVANMRRDFEKRIDRERTTGK
jgi:metallo-beta-lactamase class B